MHSSFSGRKLDCRSGNRGSIPLECASSSVRGRVAKLPGLEPGDRRFESCRTDHYARRIAWGRSLPYKKMKQSSILWPSTNMAPQFRGSEFPAFNRKEWGQHPSAPPLSSRRWYSGICASNAESGGSIPPGRSSSPHLLRQARCSKPRHGRFNSCMGHHTSADGSRRLVCEAGMARSIRAGSASFGPVAILVKAAVS